MLKGSNMIYLDTEKQCIYHGLFRPKGDYLDRAKFSGSCLTKSEFSEKEFICEKEFIDNLLKLYIIEDVEYYLKKFTNILLQYEHKNKAILEIASRYKVCFNFNSENLEYLERELLL
jgi:hypothetical protein